MPIIILLVIIIIILLGGGVIIALLAGLSLAGVAAVFGAVFWLLSKTWPYLLAAITALTVYGFYLEAKEKKGQLSTDEWTDAKSDEVWRRYRQRHAVREAQEANQVGFDEKRLEPTAQTSSRGPQRADRET